MSRSIVKSSLINGVEFIASIATNEYDSKRSAYLTPANLPNVDSNHPQFYEIINSEITVCYRVNATDNEIHEMIDDKIKEMNSSSLAAFF